MIGGHHQCVSIGNKDLVDAVTKAAPGLVDVLQRLFEISYPEAFLPVHIAVGAVIPRATNSSL
ncbi:MAG: hypothetical protein RMJ98_00460 [Myxococcales bacterium]|nr:hypothetical protein [Myxococcales bacterium]